MKERYKYNVNEYVLLILVKIVYKSSLDYKIQREDSSKITKRKVLIGQACRVASPSHLGESKGRSLDTMFLHTATVAEEVHFIYLLLVVRFKFLHFRSKLSLQLFFLH